MKKILTSILIGILALGATSCNSMLDIEQHGNLGTQEEFYQTDSDAEQALASMYISLRTIFYYWALTVDLLADDVYTGGGSRGDQRGWEKVNEYTFDYSLDEFKYLYTYLYTCIYKANLVIDKVATDTEAKARAVAEARVIRDWCHFQLVTLWGTAPVVDHVLSESEYRVSNGTAEATWEFIETDLLEAINSGALPSKASAYDEETTIRVTLELAKSLLGKTYVFQEKWSEAASILDEVIDSGLYELYADLESLPHAAANNCCESMLEAQKRNDASEAWNQYTNMYNCLLGWRTANMNFSTTALETYATGSYGFGNPRKELYEAWVAYEGADSYRLLSTMRTTEQMEEMGITPIAGTTFMGHEGYWMLKTALWNADNVYDYAALQWLQYVNYRFMRYAEVLLLAAEAHVQGGSASKAVQYVNQIRSRAQLSSLSSVDMDVIKNEKRFELCFEHCRYQDLIRWGDAQTVLAEQGKYVPIFSTAGVEYSTPNTTYGFQSKHKLLPIPQGELDVNANMVQNEGW